MGKFLLLYKKKLRRCHKVRNQTIADMHTQESLMPRGAQEFTAMGKLSAIVWLCLCNYVALPKFGCSQFRSCL